MTSLRRCLCLAVVVALGNSQQAAPRHGPALHHRQKRSVPSFDERNRPDLTGVIGHDVELPCAVHNLGQHQVMWLNDLKQEILSIGVTSITRNHRYTIRYGPGEQTWYLGIKDAEASDAGNFSCAVSTRQKMTKQFTLKMIDDSDTRRWRTDARCGPYDLLSGRLSDTRAECDRDGAYPCCSPAGWCGFTSYHCDCYDCINYREVPLPEQTITEEVQVLAFCDEPFSVLGNSSKCVLFAGERMSWRDSQDYCEQAGGRLVTFDSLDELTRETIEILNHGQEDKKFWVHLSTEGRRQTSGALMWRWIAGLIEDDHVSGERCTAVSRAPEGVTTHTHHCSHLNLPLCVQ